MKQCVNCQAPLNDGDQFCATCGQAQPQAGATPPQQPAQQPSQPQPQPPAQPPAQPQYAQQPPPPPRPPSQLQKDGKNYFKWLFGGAIGGSDLSMHPLLASIVPLLITLFMTLSVAPTMAWHAGGFFLYWLFAIVFYAGMVALGYVADRFILKNQRSFAAFYAKQSSYQLITFGLTILAFIFGLIFGTMIGFGGIFHLAVAIYILMSVLLTVDWTAKDSKKVWLAMLVIGASFILLYTVLNQIQIAGVSMGISSIWSDWGW